MKLLLDAIGSMIATILIEFIVWIVYIVLKECVSMPNMNIFNNRGLIPILLGRPLPLFGYVIFFILFIILFSLFFIAFSVPIVNEIREIQKGLDRIQNGDLSTELKVRSNTELKDIATTINTIQSDIDNTRRDREEAERLKDELVTNVAHDLRSPLTSVIGYLDLLRTGTNLKEETKAEYIQIAFDKATRMQHLVRDLFDFTRFGKDKLEAEKQKLDAVQLMEQIVDEFYPSLRENELECYTVYPKEKVFIDGDGELLARAFGNLMKNAVTYGAEGKQIRVEMRPYPETGRVRIAIVNYGKIIPKRDLKHLFDKFYRGDIARHTSGGTGLGLAIAKNIFDMHNATISVKSDTDGTVFEVLFPMI